MLNSSVVCFEEPLSRQPTARGQCGLQASGYDGQNRGKPEFFMFPKRDAF
jgi:hypothetical protein